MAVSPGGPAAREEVRPALLETLFGMAVRRQGPWPELPVTRGPSHCGSHSVALSLFRDSCGNGCGGGRLHRRKVCSPASVQVGWGRPGSYATCPSLLSLGPKLIHSLGEERKKNLNICS